MGRVTHYEVAGTFLHGAAALERPASPKEVEPTIPQDPEPRKSLRQVRTCLSKELRAAELSQEADNMARFD
jgi:hypothetical protein